MEVFIQDVPAQVTDNALRNHLRPIMDKLSIKTYYCQKQRRKRIAFITFLFAEEGTKFLITYGQDKPSRMDHPFQPKITIMSVPIFCMISKKFANQHILRNLEKENKDRKVVGDTEQEKPKPERSKEFRTSSLACGTWGYSDGELAYLPYDTTNAVGSAKFGSQSLVLKFDSGDRIDFFYKSIYGITMESASSLSFTLTLWEAPRSYKTVSSAEQRQRVPALSPSHLVVVGTCLVYRISLEQASGSSRNAHKIADRIDALRKAPGLPSIIFQQVDIRRPRKSFSNLQQELDSVLVDGAKFPFWTLNFQIRALASNGYLSFAQTLSILPEIQKVLQRSGLRKSIATVLRFRSEVPYAGTETDGSELELASLVKLLLKAEAQVTRNDQVCSDEDSPKNGIQNLAMIHRITITPAGVYLYGPEAEPMNRNYDLVPTILHASEQTFIPLCSVESTTDTANVSIGVLRKYPNRNDFFIRVLFADEDGEPVRFNPQVSNELIYNERFKDVLRKGVNVAGRQYNFLGFSHSSLRAQSCWFMAPFTHEGSLLLDRMLIQQLGDFTKIQCPAKCAARIGQAFSETPTAVAIHPDAVMIMEDVERKGRVFSDGVGTVSASVMQKIWKAVPSMRDLKPTCFQIRYQGAKGMLSLDSRLTGDRMLLRPSMIKYEGSPSVDIELCGSSLRPLPMYLNRQLIKILEDMNVNNEWFLDLQYKEVQRLRMITMNATNAGNYLRSQLIGQHSYLAWFIKRLHTIGLEFRSDKFLRDVLELSVMMQIRVLKYRARIPVSKGITLYGIMDETGFLEEGQIFCIFTEGGVKKVLIKKKVVITRAPALHPGDVQLVDAVNVPKNSALSNLSNCICFSQKGDRDLPSKLSGGDLDGDLYNIIWDPGCKPTKTCLPADYPRVPPQDISRKVERDDMTDFFVKFMETDQLGRIAINHLILADQTDLGTLDEGCKTLAEMHSVAVDFSKTGIPVNLRMMPKLLSPVRPDFMSSGPNIKIEKKDGLLVEQPSSPDQTTDDDEDFTPYRFYSSDKILGKLYRAVDEHEIFSELHRYRKPSDSMSLLDQVWDHVSRACSMVTWHQYVTEAQGIRDTYEDCLLNIMRSYSEHPLRPLSELEAFIGDILGAQGSQSRKQRNLSMTMKEAFDRDVAFVVGSITGSDDNGGADLAKALPLSIACFHVSLGEATRVPMGGRGGGPLVSFRYIAAAVCLKQMDMLVEEQLGEELNFGALSLK